MAEIILNNKRCIWPTPGGFPIIPGEHKYWPNPYMQPENVCRTRPRFWMHPFSTSAHLLLFPYKLLIWLTAALFLFHTTIWASIPPGNTKSLKKIYQTGKIKFFNELEINRDSFPEEVDLKEISALSVGEKNIYVLDSRYCDIKILSGDGKFIKKFGQKGRGPGDLYWPRHMVIRPGELIVWENMNQRFSIFTHDGKFIRVINSKNKGYVLNMKMLEDGRIVLERRLAGMEKNKYVNFSILELYSSKLEFIKTIYKREIFQEKYIRQYNKRLLIPFYKDVSWDILPGSKIVIGYPEKYRVEILDPETGKTQTFSHTNTQVKVTEEDKMDFFENMITSGPNGRPIIGADQFTRKNTEFPGYKPAFSKVITDSEGNILVFLYKNSKNGRFKYFDAFDSMGKFINQVEIISENGIYIDKMFSGKENVFWDFVLVDELDIGVIKYRVE